MVASRVGGSNLTLPKCRSLSTSPWDLEGELLWVQTFDSIEDCEPQLVEFAAHYNKTWLVAPHG
jgi:hypothetical protein